MVYSSKEQLQSEEAREFIRKSEREIEAKWRKVHVNMIFLASVCIIVSECLVSFLITDDPTMISDPSHYVIWYLGIPAISYLIIDIVAYVGMKKLAKQGRKLNYLLSILLAVMCVLITIYHGVFPSVYGIGILAIVMTFIYGNHKLGAVTMAVVMGGNIMAFIFLPWDDKVVHTTVYDMSALIMFIATAGVFVLGGAVVVWEQQFRKTAILGNYKLDALKKVAAKDFLTGVRNRYGMQEYIDGLNGTCHCVMLDVDYFKKINDKWGHDRGDEVLETLGEILQQYEDHNRAVFRYGGDEFLFVIQNHKEEEVRLICREINRVFCENLTMEMKREEIGITFGLSPEVDVKDVQRGILLADQELYQKKHAYN
ncbi:MAG: GGDEF domain-containing protein [Eubacterium sp.]|nr:GGDEF domain-containing protein [Eubacterium sp.]